MNRRETPRQRRDRERRRKQLGLGLGCPKDALGKHLRAIGYQPFPDLYHVAWEALLHFRTDPMMVIMLPRYFGGICMATRDGRTELKSCEIVEMLNLQHLARVHFSAPACQ